MYDNYCESVEEQTIFGTCAGTWSHMCIYGSPWLFLSQTRYTLVDRVNVKICASTVVYDAFWKAWSSMEPNDHDAQTSGIIVVNRATYEPWADLFEFDWETLDLVISDTQVHFVDSMGRTSVETFDPSSRELLRGRLSDSNTIPWLNCQS
jgi:hypothetical protein